MIDWILIGILATLLGAAIWYICKAKKNGQKCIGCPGGCSCGAGGKGASCHGCGSSPEKHP